MQDAGQFRQDGLSADRAVAELRSAPAGGSRKKAISLQQSVLSLYIENRQSTIGNSSHPGPSDDRRKSSPREKKMKTSGIEDEQMRSTLTKLNNGAAALMEAGQHVNHVQPRCAARTA
jgi:hypothetical protein